MQISLMQQAETDICSTFACNCLINMKIGSALARKVPTFCCAFEICTSVIFEEDFDFFFVYKETTVAMFSAS
jgi:hypothetical protein